ncbi:MAG TPA: 16S rRNA (guanine(527)-N(7))-methyltransferase RsmG [Candidatus Binataceae bacterium]|nr:16S rRNA (guanine(527)-N(7))-methyltransferase RsmG [Candidatus Binataceae bacterium]
MKPAAKKSPRRKRQLSPEQVAAQVRAELAPALSGIGVVARNPALLDRIERFVHTLVTWGSKINLTANPNDPGEILFHVFDSLIPIALAIESKALRMRPAFERETRVLDVGSGAGFPGLVIAAALPVRVTLAEARRRRASFLEDAAIEMGLRTVEVIAKRAEDIDLRAGFDLMTARAVGDYDETFKLAARALHPGGVLMLYTSADQRAKTAGAEAAGLAALDSIPYELPHRHAQSHRVAMLWTRR